MGTRPRWKRSTVPSSLYRYANGVSGGLHLSMISTLEVDDYYDAATLNPAALTVKDRTQARCPVHGCTATLEECSYNTRWRLPYCKIHAIRLHPNPKLPTFVYYNGEGREDTKRARLRNIQFHKDFVRNRVLDNRKKAETHRLGHENSEDALSWNVFTPLLQAGRLGLALQSLSRKRLAVPSTSPELYLWGSRIDLATGTFKEYQPLLAARQHFEKDIRPFLTEPDIMLITDQVVMCIEAKLTSGNPLAVKGAKTEPGAKPKTREGIVQRYFDTWSEAKRYIDRERLMENELHSQLFRNIIFAAWMAELEGKSWHVVNLTSSTQWSHRRQISITQGNYDFHNPTTAIAGYLGRDFQDHFTFYTWEELYREIVQGHPGLGELEVYLRGKTAHLNRAFNI